MTTEEARSIVAVLAAAWPASPFDRGTVRSYVETIVDLDWDEVSQAVAEFRRDERVFAPSAGEVCTLVVSRRMAIPSVQQALVQVDAHTYWRAEHTTCVECDGLGYPDVDADDVCQACRGGGEQVVGSRPALHPVVATSLDLMGGRFAREEADKPEVFRAQFAKHFAAARSSAIREENLTSAGIPLDYEPGFDALPAAAVSAVGALEVSRGRDSG